MFCLILEHLILSLHLHVYQSCFCLVRSRYIANLRNLQVKGSYANECFKDIPQKVLGINFPLDLIEFPLDNFDVVLGMDWLRNYKASIDCWLKKVFVQGFNGQRATYNGFVPNTFTKIISIIMLKSYLRRNYPKILCHVIDTSVSTPKVGEIRVVCEFEDVFPSAIPGLYRPRVVDLTIDLVTAQVLYLRLHTTLHLKRQQS